MKTRVIRVEAKDTFIELYTEVQDGHILDTPINSKNNKKKRFL